MAQAADLNTTSSSSAHAGALLSLADLNTTINHEPRILDLTVAERLGYDRPRVIRELVERNREELETYGSLAVRHGKSRGQEFAEFYLNEGQSLVICALSRTPQAASVRKAIIDVFMAYRSGTLPTAPRTTAVRAHRRVVVTKRETPFRLESLVNRLERAANSLKVGAPNGRLIALPEMPPEGKPLVLASVEEWPDYPGTWSVVPLPRHGDDPSMEEIDLNDPVWFLRARKALEKVGVWKVPSRCLGKKIGNSITLISVWA